MKSKNSTSLLLVTASFFAATVGLGQINVPFENIKPKVITDTVKWDTDDPAIWINQKNRKKSLIIGTDKNSDGALYAFNLKGEPVKRAGGLRRPNNVDIACGFKINGQPTDIAVVTEREAQRLRIFRLPELQVLDAGNLTVFDGDKNRAPMGIALYKRPTDHALFAFVSGKSGPELGYINQYRIECNEVGMIEMKQVRSFGRYSGKKEIESIAVDEELGFVYYSDETVGIRKYHADPDAADANKELALFGNQGFAEDHEGISIYKTTDTTGYILVSDQQANQFRIFNREGTTANPHEHVLLKVIKVQAEQSDGSEITNKALPGFPAGMLVAMSQGKTFHYYSWEDIAGSDLKKYSSVKNSFNAK